jgi:hypothetical protein
MEAFLSGRRGSEAAKGGSAGPMAEPTEDGRLAGERQE